MCGGGFSMGFWGVGEVGDDGELWVVLANDGGARALG